MRLAAATTLLSAAFLLGACALDDGPETGADPEPEEVEIIEQGTFEGDFELHMANAQDFYDAGDYFRARQQFAKAVAKNSSSNAARLGEAFSAYNIGFNAAALGNLGPAEKQLGDSEKLFGALWPGTLPASTTEGTGMEWKSALGLAMTWRAQASLDKMRIARIDSILNTAPRDKVSGLLEEQRTRDLRRGRNNGKALELFRRLAAMQYAAPDAVKNLGDMELITGNIAQAITAYESFLDISRRNIANWDRRRDEWPQQFEIQRYALEAQKAIDAKRASAVDKTVEVLLQVAEIRYKDEAYEYALEHLREALSLAPDRVAIHVPVAECLDEIGDKVGAIEHLDVFLKSRTAMDEDTRRALRLRSRLAAELGS